MAWHGMAWHGMAWHGMAWHGMTWHGMTWHSVRPRSQPNRRLTRPGPARSAERRPDARCAPGVQVLNLKGGAAGEGGPETRRRSESGPATHSPEAQLAGEQPAWVAHLLAQMADHGELLRAQAPRVRIEGASLAWRKGRHSIFPRAHAWDCLASPRSSRPPRVARRMSGWTRSRSGR
jgi:hypothetical protein